MTGLTYEEAGELSALNDEIGGLKEIHSELLKLIEKAAVGGWDDAYGAVIDAAVGVTAAREYAEEMADKLEERK